MSKFFGYVNEFNPHNKSRHSNLALVKYWVTQYGWIWLHITVAMGMTIINLWKIFFYGVNIYHYEKLIDTRELSEQLTIDLFNNPFTTDTRNQVKNPLLDEINDLKTVLTRH